MSLDVISSAVVRRTPADVFQFLCRPENDLLWTSGLIEAKVLTAGPFGTGTRIERVSKFLGRRMTYTIDVTEIVEDERIEMTTSAGPFPIQVTYLLEPVDGGTRFSIRNRGEPSGFFALTGPLLAVAVRRQVQLDVETLADILASAST